MDIALAYGLNMRVEELEKMQQKRNRTAITLRKTKFERDEAKKELNRAIKDRDEALDSLKKEQEATRHWKEKAESFQDEAIEKMPKRALVKKDPTAEEVVINIPFVGKKPPTVDQLDR